MSQSPKPSPVTINKEGFVVVDGVKVAKFIPERQSIQFLDRDRRRCAEKGREVVEVRLCDLADIPQKK